MQNRMVEPSRTCDSCSYCGPVLSSVLSLRSARQTWPPPISSRRRGWDRSHSILPQCWGWRDSKPAERCRSRLELRHVLNVELELEPWTIPIAELPLAIAELFATRSRRAKAKLRTSTELITPGNRHEHLRQISYAMRRYSGASQEAIEAALLTENEKRCSPPKAEHLVRALAAYTFEHIAPIDE